MGKGVKPVRKSELSKHTKRGPGWRDENSFQAAARLNSVPNLV